MNSTSTVLMFFCGVVFILAVLIRGAMRRKAAGPTNARASDRQDFTPVRDQIDKLLVDLQETSRELIARLDNKIRMANQLIKEIDDKKAQVEKLVKQLESMPKPRESRDSPPPPPLNPLHEKIYKGIDGGASVEELCRDTGMERGEVELILGLRKIDK